jgi:hypothetical protein
MFLDQLDERTKSVISTGAGQFYRPAEWRNPRIFAMPVVSAV